LEVALFGFLIAGEGRLRLLVLELVKNLSVGDVAHLVVLLDKLSVFVAHAIFALGHHSIAGVVCFADVAVDAFPSLVAFAGLVPFPRYSVLPIREGAAKGLGTVFSSEARRAVAFAICLAAFGILMALKVVKVAVEAGRAAIGAIAVYGEEGFGRECLIGRGVAIRFVCCSRRRPC
jgi:hypothetical protein